MSPEATAQGTELGIPACSNKKKSTGVKMIPPPTPNKPAMSPAISPNMRRRMVITTLFYWLLS